MTVLLENSLNFHLVTSLVTLSNQNLKKIDFSAKFFQWKKRFACFYMWMDLFRSVFSAIFSLKVLSNWKHETSPSRSNGAGCWEQKFDLLSQKSDANFAGAKLKNFLAKKNRRIFFFSEIFWQKFNFLGKYPTKPAF